MGKSWYVYIITNYRNSVFYTGVTNNLERRVNEHKKGYKKKSFCHRYRIYKLVWFGEFPTPLEAIQAEKIIKDYRREKKLNLIKKMNSKLIDLSTLRDV